MQLTDKVAIVTGGDSGIGKAIALTLAREGARVVIDCHGDKAPAEELTGRIAAAGGVAIAFAADVTSENDVEALVAAAVNAYGGVDVLVNNAGIEKKQPFLETPLTTFQEVMAVNLTGTWLCSQAVARQMVKQKRGGRIVNISSVHEEMTMPTNAPYCASKGAVRMLMRTIAVELAEYGITVNNVAPGAVDTPMDAPLKKDPKEMDTLLAEIPLHRMAKPEEIAGVVAFLASDDAAYITGATYLIDGGMTKQSGSL
ncbi:MAG: SDR family oxidoreductase [Candidatus Eremiobacteraeota bacterium]|nr:SDR family oxidoreductase [Candidatus Eremiobacteraeota bacterium]